MIRKNDLKKELNRIDNDFNPEVDENSNFDLDEFSKNNVHQEKKGHFGN
jgi:hypothetical protein